MKLPEYSGKATVTNMTAVDIGISDDPTDQLLILNVLSNTLYTDKVTAVWREYGCNAYDANIEAGRADKPIEITLPNKLAPEAKIRDYGYGMTDEQVLQVFCKLGRSTKRGSNEMTGMLGIGSKAGFAYGDNFTVTSWAKGKKTIYTCFRDQGVPRLSKMHEQASSEPEGVEVKVPVRLTDIPDFCTKAERIFRYFKVRPIVHGGNLVYLKRGNPKFQGTNWRYIGDNNGSFAVMGNIGYEVNTASMSTGFPPKLLTLLGLGIELDFNIGELEIAANREGLQFRDKTNNALIAALKQVTTEIAQVFVTQLAKAASFWEAKQLYHELFQGNGYNTRTLQDVIGQQLTWNKIPITSAYIPIENKEKDPEVHIVQYNVRSWGRPMVKLRNYIDNVIAGDQTLLVINDLPSKKWSPSRMRHWATNHKDVQEIVVMLFDSDAAQKRYLQRRMLEGAPMIKFSDMPKPPPTPRTATQSIHKAKHSSTAFALVAAPPKMAAGSYSIADSQYWEIKPVDLDKETGVWVTLDRFCAIGPHKTVTPHHLQEQVSALKKAGILSNSLFGFKEKRADKVAKAKGWTELSLHLKEHIATVLKDNAAQQSLADYIHAAEHQPIVHLKNMSLFPAKSEMRKYLDLVWKMRNPASNMELWWIIQTKICDAWFGKPDKLPKPTVNLQMAVDKVFAQYPMLPEWNEYQLRNESKSCIAPVIEYVKLIGS
jgi:Histidine kinase-, DNA gyrase B-, and HSP90-like ATPase